MNKGTKNKNGTKELLIINIEIIIEQIEYSIM